MSQPSPQDLKGDPLEGDPSLDGAPLPGTASPRLTWVARLLACALTFTWLLEHVLWRTSPGRRWISYLMGVCASLVAGAFVSWAFRRWAPSLWRGLALFGAPDVLPEARQSATRPRPWSHVLFLAVLTLALVGVYRPTLSVAFESDQSGLMLEFGGSTSLKDSFRHWDYSLTRRYGRGDELLYRPATFLYMGLQNTLHGYHHARWNLASLLTHAFVCGTLYWLLLALQPPGLAKILTAAFALNPAAFGLVAFQHVAGYTFGFGCLLLALRAALPCLLERGAWTPADRWLYVLAMTISCLAHEAPILSCGALVGLSGLRGLARREPRRELTARILVLATPLFLYVPQYLVHCLRARQLFVVAGQRDPRTPAALLQVLEAWTQWLSPARAAGPALTALVGISALVLALGLARSLRKTALTERSWLSALLVVSLAAYVALALAGRGPAVAGAIHYTYLYCLYLLVLGATCVDWGGLPPLRRRVAAFALGVLVLAGALATARESRRRAETTAARDDYFDQLVSFVDAHRNEPGFSFAVANPPPALDPLMGMLDGPPDARRIDPMLHSQAVFVGYYDPARPRYLLHWEGERFEVEGPK